MRQTIRSGARVLLTAFTFVHLFSLAVIMQQPAATPAKPGSSMPPKVTRIDIEGLKPLLKANGKPLLINFWATWCDPCREEFPDLVNIDKTYRGKIDFITISLDDVTDIDTLVPKFLGEVKAEMPAFLLSTTDESAAIKLVSDDWAGNLPLTIMYDEKGAVAYKRNGKVKVPALIAEIDKALAKPAPVTLPK